MSRMLDEPDSIWCKSNSTKALAFISSAQFNREWNPQNQLKPKHRRLPQKGRSKQTKSFVFILYLYKQKQKPASDTRKPEQTTILKIYIRNLFSTHFVYKLCTIYPQKPHPHAVLNNPKFNNKDASLTSWVIKQGGDSILQFVMAVLAIAVSISREVREWYQLLKKK